MPRRLADDRIWTYLQYLHAMMPAIASLPLQSSCIRPGGLGQKRPLMARVRVAHDCVDDVHTRVTTRREQASKAALRLG